MFNRRVGLLSTIALGIAAGAAMFAPTIKINEPALAPASQGIERRRTLSKRALAGRTGNPLYYKKHVKSARPAKKTNLTKSRKRRRAKVRMRSHRSRA